MRSGPFERRDDEPRDRDWACRLFAGIAAERSEVVVLVYFDPEWRYLGARHCASDAPGRITLPVREIMRDALSLDVRLVMMAHNHPSGDHRPSEDDLAVTSRLSRTLDAIEVRLVDHLILGRDGCTSLRDEGYL
ncbi:MAG: DNA repair protein [Sphingomonas sp.]|uniref:JAB domain-containing protein n=1 Tax=Sphingomonas sp. TaxID=28214 RepID=UPI001AD2FD35|nr:JAB domain-containing protein [Sphingomonas sp.]MBN8816865.1 DNA repair protein [Sphingomonas sp.]